MEKEGLSHGLEFLKQKGLEVKVLVTGRHRQINKWLRKTNRKKMEALAELCVDGNRGDAGVHDEEPAPLSSQYTRPDMDTAISNHKSNLIYVVIIIIIVCITNFTNVDICSHIILLYIALHCILQDGILPANLLVLGMD